VSRPATSATSSTFLDSASSRLQARSFPSFLGFHSGPRSVILVYLKSIKPLLSPEEQDLTQQAPEGLVQLEWGRRALSGVARAGHAGPKTFLRPFSTAYAPSAAPAEFPPATVKS
jgi:hypothetical protein